MPAWGSPGALTAPLQPVCELVSEACPCRLRRLRVPTKTQDGVEHTIVPSRPVFARLRRIMSRDTYIIYKVGWVAYRTIFRARGLEVKIPRQGQRHASGDASPCISPLEE